MIVLDKCIMVSNKKSVHASFFTMDSKFRYELFPVSCSSKYHFLCGVSASESSIC